MSKKNTKKIKEETLMKKKIRIIILLFILLFLFIGSSYAFFRLDIFGTKTNVIKAGTLSLKLDESLSEGISLIDAYPISDSDGVKQSTVYKFIVNNDGDISNKYTIYLDDMALDDNEVRMSDSDVKYRLIKNNTEGECKLISSLGVNPNRILDTDTLEPGKSNTYTLQVWMNYDAGNEAQNTVFSASLRIDASQIVE